MAELDKDLLAIAEVRDLLRRAAAAQKTFEAFDQESVDRVTKSMAQAGARAAESLARLAVEETGYGRADSKRLKNLFSTEVLWESIKDLKTVGVVRRDDAAGIYEVAAPYGVVASIIPTTNPTSTALFKGIISVKARNATVMSPHPRSVRCVRETCQILNDAAVRAGAPDGLVLCLSAPSLEATHELMHHRLTNVILATGGAGLVKAAYSSGKPAYGVGPGNVPAYVERTADLEHAVRCIVASQTFDWSTICASEQAVIVDRAVADATLAEFRRQGAHFCSDEETRALERLCVRGELMNPEIVGMAPHRLAERAGFRVPESTTVLLAPQEGVGPKYPLSREILTPLLAWYVVRDWREGCARCIEVLTFGGDGHTMAVHTRSEEVVTAFALEKPCNRILINAPTSQGSVGLATNLEASMTLGCGPMGRNITSDNITARHLVNLKRVAIVRADWWPIAARYAAGRSGVDFPVAASRHLATPEGGARPAQGPTPRAAPRWAAATAAGATATAAGATATAAGATATGSTDHGRYGGNAPVLAPAEAPAWSSSAHRAPAMEPAAALAAAPVSTPSGSAMALARAESIAADPVRAALLGRLASSPRPAPSTAAHPCPKCGGSTGRCGCG